MHIPVAHVEAGLRSFNRSMPEEINRVLTDHGSNFLFCPTEQAVGNLKFEGVGENRSVDQKSSVIGCNERKLTSALELFRSKPKVALVGDVMLDAVLFYRRFAKKPKLELPGQFVLATIHRAENTDDPERLINIFKDMIFLFGMCLEMSKERF